MKCKTTRGVLLGLMLYTIALLFMIGASSCSTSKPASTTSEVSSTSEKEEKKESSSYKETLTFSEVTIPGDSSKIKAQLQIDPETKTLKPFKANSGGKRSKLSVEVDSVGNLTSSCECEEEKATIASKEIEVKLLTEHLWQQALHQESKATDVVHVPYTAWYDYLARVVALLYLLNCLLILIWYLIKKYPYVKIFGK